MGKTKILLKEIKTIIEEKTGLNVFKSFSFSDRSKILKSNPKYPNDTIFIPDTINEQRYFGVCEFNVMKKYNTECFIVWDYREHQPFEKSKYWIKVTPDITPYIGRYEFVNREEFLNHIFSDFGMSVLDKLILKNKNK